MADAVVVVINQIQEPVPDLGHIALNVAWAKAPDCHLAHPRVVVVGQIEQPFDLIASPALARHRQTDADALADQGLRAV